MPIPFPVASGRYETGPSMRRFGQAGQGFPAEEGHFWTDELLGATLAAKLAVLKQAPAEAHLFAPADDEDGLRAALQESLRLLAAEHPTLPDPGPVGQEIQEWLAGQQGLERLGNSLGLSVQEDLAIVRGPAAEGEPDVLEWLHVCLPSSWAPAEKIGRSFGAVHEPVAHSQQLQSSRGQIVRAMIHAGPFTRYVWGIHRDGELCHNPRIHRPAPWRADASPEEVARQAWFRVERQTTHGFPHLNRALFTIRYWVAPLAEVAADPWQRERLAAALAGMDEEAMAYKGLGPVRDKLVQLHPRERSMMRNDGTSHY